jgi:LmbE family N-acetylglucosaminyl deacetylase
MGNETLTILAVGGHIGDMELTAGMALAKHALEGSHIVTLALTAGEKGAPKGRELADYRKQKVAEAQAFATLLKGESIVFDYPDGELPDNEEVRMSVCDVIRKVRPNILITHYKSSMHKDHNTTHNIVTDARYYAALPGFVRTEAPHFAQHFYFTENWEDAVGYKPYLYIDTTEGYELWKKAVATHRFVTGSTSFPYLEYYDHLSRVRGIEARKGRAETFMVPPEAYRVIREGL